MQVIARAANILRVLEDKPKGSRSPKSHARSIWRDQPVQRILTALAAEDFVIEAQPGRGTRIGPGLARIAASLASNLTELLHPRSGRAEREVGETVDLSVLSGGSRFSSIRYPVRQRLVALSAVGQRFPLHCTANGKAMLACYPNKQAAAIVEKSIAAHPEHSLVDRANLLKEIVAGRRQASRFRFGRTRFRHWRHRHSCLRFVRTSGRGIDSGAVVPLRRTPKGSRQRPCCVFAAICKRYVVGRANYRDETALENSPAI